MKAEEAYRYLEKLVAQEQALLSKGKLGRFEKRRLVGIQAELDRYEDLLQRRGALRKKEAGEDGEDGEQAAR